MRPDELFNNPLVLQLRAFYFKEHWYTYIYIYIYIAVQPRISSTVGLSFAFLVVTLCCCCCCVAVVDIHFRFLEAFVEEGEHFWWIEVAAELTAGAGLEKD